MHRKFDCADALVAQFVRTEGWSRSLEKQYPDDSRNKPAANLLLQFSRDAAILSDEQFSKLQPIYNWASPAWASAISDAARRVGFQRRIRTLDDFIEHVVALVNEKQAAA